VAGIDKKGHTDSALSFGDCGSPGVNPVGGIVGSGAGSPGCLVVAGVVSC
jgi:hypothetical protein